RSLVRSQARPSQLFSRFDRFAFLSLGQRPGFAGPRHADGQRGWPRPPGPGAAAHDEMKGEATSSLPGDPIASRVRDRWQESRVHVPNRTSTSRKELCMATATSTADIGERWAGWIRFAGIMMLIISMIDFFQGMIAVIRGEYYAITPNQIIVFDLSTWGWLMILWAVVVGLTGFGLLAGATWARWVTIVVGSLNVL